MACIRTSLSPLLVSVSYGVVSLPCNIDKESDSVQGETRAFLVAASKAYDCCLSQQTEDPGEQNMGNAD